jgi:hypothetical protein
MPEATNIMPPKEFSDSCGGILDLSLSNHKEGGNDYG